MSNLKQILVCDDDLYIRRALSILLRDAGFQSMAAATAKEALDVAAVHTPKAAIIDLVLPDGDGVEVCRRLRQSSDMPIMALSGVGDEDVKIRALDAGADDYITKPFAPGELVARLRANLRRAEPAHEDAVFLVGGLEVDLTARAVRSKGKEIRLTPIEYELLQVLVRNCGRLMTHRALLSQVWGSAYEHDKQTLQCHMANLRRKLDPDSERQRYIRTDFGVGYRFVGELERVPSELEPTSRNL
jgi:two-component system KDP operon response regulator KdpE